MAGTRRSTRQTTSAVPKYNEGNSSSAEEKIVKRKVAKRTRQKRAREEKEEDEEDEDEQFVTTCIIISRLAV
jgi:ribosomal protein L4